MSSLHRSYDSPVSMANWQIQLELEETRGFIIAGGRLTFEQLERYRHLIQREEEILVADTPSPSVSPSLLDLHPGAVQTFMEHYSRQDTSTPYSIDTDDNFSIPETIDINNIIEPGSNEDENKENFNFDTFIYSNRTFNFIHVYNNNEEDILTIVNNNN